MIKASEMIQRLKEQAKEIQPMKVNTPKAIKYLTKLKRGQTPLVKKLHNILLAGKHEVITMEQFEKLLKEYPEVTEISSKEKQSFLNSKISTVQFYTDGALDFTVILSEGVLYKFKK
jgi:prophage DNA circulation protein